MYTLLNMKNYVQESDYLCMYVFVCWMLWVDLWVGGLFTHVEIIGGDQIVICSKAGVSVCLQWNASSANNGNNNSKAII